ncbi:MAG: alanine racemase [Pseudomonadota bacterium]
MTVFRSAHHRDTHTLIHLSALKQNWDAIVARIPKGSRILPVVKANGYGHGTLTIARECARLGAVGMGVAEVGEALSLRYSGYAEEVLCFGEFSAETVIRAGGVDVTFVLHSKEEIPEVIPAIRRLSVPARIHLEIETGMHRLGIEPDDWRDVALRLRSLPEIRVEGIFSHFSESEAADLSFSEHQQSELERAATLFEEILGHRLIRHVANSGGVLNLPASRLDWVRPGLLLYGYAPGQILPAGEFRPVLEWRAPIIQIKKIRKGDRVGYGSVFCAPQDMTIGTVAVGYGDGYRRGFVSAGVGYRGKRRKIVGSVCMDLLMVDLSDLADPRRGDDIVLMGDGSQGEPTAAELASAEGSLAYQVLTGISARVGREAV